MLVGAISATTLSKASIAGLFPSRKLDPSLLDGVIESVCVIISCTLEPICPHSILRRIWPSYSTRVFCNAHASSKPRLNYLCSVSNPPLCMNLWRPYRGGVCRGILLAIPGTFHVWVNYFLFFLCPYEHGTYITLQDCHFVPLNFVLGNLGPYCAQKRNLLTTFAAWIP